MKVVGIGGDWALDWVAKVMFLCGEDILVRFPICIARFQLFVTDGVLSFTKDYKRKKESG